MNYQAVSWQFESWFKQFNSLKMLIYWDQNSLKLITTTCQSEAKNFKQIVNLLIIYADDSQNFDVIFFKFIG